MGFNTIYEGMKSKIITDYGEYKKSMRKGKRSIGFDKDYYKLKVSHFINNYIYFKTETL